MDHKHISFKKKKSTSGSQSVVEQLAGSLKNSVPYMDHSIAREYTARAFAKKYLLTISLTRFRQHFSHYIQRVKNGETITFIYKKYPHDYFVIRPCHSKIDASVFAELACL
ncbi:MAG: hypothetical protein AAB457_03635 [Patescibacteria group bacterium]